MKLQLDDVALFTRIAELGTLSAPARERNVPVSQVTRSLAPQLHVELRADDRLADLARDDIDIAVRTGELASDTLVARRIGAFGRTVVASPAYLERFGTPRTVAELDAHRLIGCTANAEMNRWPLRNAGEEAAYQIRAHTRSDNVALILALARGGVGVGRVMDLPAAPLIRRGELVPLLQAEIDSQCVPIHALIRGAWRSAAGGPTRPRRRSRARAA